MGAATRAGGAAGGGTHRLERIDERCYGPGDTAESGHIGEDVASVTKAVSKREQIRQRREEALSGRGGVVGDRRGAAVAQGGS